VSRSNSGISVIKQQQKNEPKRTAKRSSSIQINNSIKASSILLTQLNNNNNNNNNKEVRRSISLKNKLDNNLTTTDSVLTKHKSAFKPVASIATSKQDLIKTNIEKSNKQLPFRNNSTFQNNNSSNKKQTNSLNSNSSSSISSVSIINGINQVNKTPISKLVEVTWSVSNIKKKFESNLEPATTTTTGQQQHYSFKLNRGLKNLDENSYVCLKGYKDSSGNSVTYI